MGIILIVTILGMFFCFASFKVHSNSMEPTLISGDYVLVNKMIKGARLFNFFKALDKKNIEISRIKGYDSFKRNDVLVFNFPYSGNIKDSIHFDISNYFIKRCIALPGDTLDIKNGVLKVKGCQEILGNQLAQIQASSLPDSILPKMYLNAYPQNRILNWTIKNLGPFPIPAKGQSININATTISLYQNLINWEQKSNIITIKDTVYLRDSLIKQYCFRENYYFVAGDNVKNSQDSRHWGLLPESFIVGKAIMIWKSNERTGRLRWDRIFSKII